MPTRITIHMDTVHEILNVRQVPELVYATGRAVHARAVAYTPRETGAMAASNRLDVDVAEFRRVVARIYNTDEAAWWVNRGTGIYSRDGSGGPIRPKRSKYLRFPDRDGPGWVYARSVLGQPAQEFLWKALRDSVFGGGPQFQLWTLTKRVP